MAGNGNGADPARRADGTPAVPIAVIGSGYVGTTVAACFAWAGHWVVAVESDHHRLRCLRSGRAPFLEAGLDGLLLAALQDGRLRFSDNILDAMASSQVVFLCVGAPMGADGRPDMRALDAAGRAIGGALTDQVVVNKSTIPIGGAQWLASIIEDSRPAHARHCPVHLVSNPEFLREGAAVRDFLHPSRIVLGGKDSAAIDAVVNVYRPILDQRFEGAEPARRPVLVRTSPETAEVIKFAANAFLATKVSFINQVANICEPVGADVEVVAMALGLDSRIGPEFLRAGIGWGGSCFGKDLAEIIATAEQYDVDADLLRAVRAINGRQRGLVVRKLRAHLRVLQGRRVCLLGLSFKPGTDDVRDAPAIGIARDLLELGTLVTAHDPVVKQIPGLPDLELASDPYQAADEADATVLVTDWPEFLELDYGEMRRRMRGNLFIDGRNSLDAQGMALAGFRYESIGRRWADRNEHPGTPGAPDGSICILLPPATEDQPVPPERGAREAPCSQSS